MSKHVISTEQTKSQKDHDDFIKMKIEKGERSGLTKKQSREEMLAEFKNDLQLSSS